MTDDQEVSEPTESEWLAERTAEGLVFIIAFNQMVDGFQDENSRITDHLQATVHPTMLSDIVYVVECKTSQRIELPLKPYLNYVEMFQEELNQVRNRLDA